MTQAGMEVGMSSAVSFEYDGELLKSFKQRVPTEHADVTDLRHAELVRSPEALAAGIPCQPYCESGHKDGAKRVEALRCILAVIQWMIALAPLYGIYEEVTNFAANK